MDMGKVDTLYLEGEEVTLPFDESVWNSLGPYEKDAWAENWLRENGIKIRWDCHLNRSDWHGGSKPLHMKISNTDYKEKLNTLTKGKTLCVKPY